MTKMHCHYNPHDDHTLYHSKILPSNIFYTRCMKKCSTRCQTNGVLLTVVSVEDNHNNNDNTNNDNDEMRLPVDRGLLSRLPIWVELLGSHTQQYAAAVKKEKKTLSYPHGPSSSKMTLSAFKIPG